eukprot:scaffold39684_cov70-Attheya_sp.AAC.3
MSCSRIYNNFISVPEVAQSRIQSQESGKGPAYNSCSKPTVSNYCLVENEICKHNRLAVTYIEEDLMQCQKTV